VRRAGSGRRCGEVITWEIAGRLAVECMSGRDDSGLLQEQAPLLAALNRRRQENPYPLQTPGHKLGRGAPAGLTGLLGAALEHDFCEGGGLDNLHDPQGALAAAQALLAAHYGADASFFLVNGSTAGVQALIGAACRPGESLVLSRMAHRSAVTGLIVTGALPVWVPPVWCRDWGLPLGMDGEATPAALAATSAVALLATSPSYWGGIADLPALAAACQAQGALLLVDEAWGAHLHMLPEYRPYTAMIAGATACVQSAHKTLGALTQGAWLHIKGNARVQERCQEWSRMLQSSSPSYLLLASLDAARRQAATDGQVLGQRAVRLARELACRLDALPGIRVLSVREAQTAGLPGLDPCRLAVSALAGGWSGWKVAAELRRAGVQPELEAPGAVLLLVSLGDGEEMVAEVVAAFTDISRRMAVEKDPQLATAVRLSGLQPPLPEVVVSPREAFFAPSRVCDLDEAEGEVSGTLLAPLPPGMPLLCPGERISSAVVHYLQELVAAGWDGFRKLKVLRR